MKVALKEFQTTNVAKLYQQVLRARREVQEGGDPQAVILSAPTGSGKTLMMTGLMERILTGDETYPGDPDACFLWITDAPDLNEQSRRKILAGSSVFRLSDVITIDAAFDQARFDPGKLYFLNTQKLGKERDLVTAGDERRHTIWETTTATVAAAPGSFCVVLDEAHKGMIESRTDRELAATIVQKFVKGSPGEIPEIPLIIGLSATPERFLSLIGGRRVPRRVDVSPDDVRESGLLKDTVYLHHPKEGTPADFSLLRAAAEQLLAYEREWASYAEQEREPSTVRPALVVQVEDASGGKPSRTDLEQALRTVEEVTGPLPDSAVAHAFQDGQALDVGGRAIRRVAPPDIEDDPNLRVVLFKTSLNTGWDCPRAEVMMSFRRAVDHTVIAQLVGRMVRTPLARRVEAREVLNTVALYLPHYDREGVAKVVSYLTDAASEGHAPVAVEEGADVVDLVRAQGSERLFAALDGLPTYEVARVPRQSNTKRLLQFARALAFDKLDPGAIADATALVLGHLGKARQAVCGTEQFKEAVASRRSVSVRRVAVDYLTAAATDAGSGTAETVEADIEELFEASGRRLGEGLHAAYARDRAEGGAALAEAKAELSVLLEDPKVLAAVEVACDERIHAWFQKHQASILGLGESRRQVYARVRRTAVKPLAGPLVLPDTIQARRSESVWSAHIYVDADGRFPCSLNSWERRVIDAELRRGDVVGWLRNTERKPWALRVPYKLDGEVHPTFPDFLIVRDVGGNLIPDVLEPHRHDLDDFAAKAVGLAEYADEHGQRFGRIEILTVLDGTGPLKRLDLNVERIRNKVKAVTDNAHLRQLFDTDGV